MILIYSKDIDDFVNQVIDCLHTNFIRIGGENDALVIEDFSINKSQNELNVSNTYFKATDFDTVTSIWFNGGFANTVGSSYENSCLSMVIDSFVNYKTGLKIGRLRSDFEVNKLDVPLEAKKQGFKVPETLITGNKNTLLTFYNKHITKNGIISKRITDQYIYETDDFWYDFNLTFSIDSEILDKIPNQFAISLFQEKIVADFEIRVVYIKGFFYAMSIHTFDNEIDYRTKFGSLKNIRTTSFKLPTDIENKLEKVFEKFNLNYGSADLMYKNGDFYFLEINPTGQVSFFNNACNYYIENKLANLLQNEA
ncbi:hypothetical protein [Kordia sp.]|uniref:hypothetical protein n=1 Tax=Kordia sp. TaxID=1965332 RepID=UPI003D2AB103